MPSVGAVESPPDGAGLTGSGVRRGRSVGSGVGVDTGSALSPGAAVAGASVAGADVAPGLVVGLLTAGVAVAGGWVPVGVGVRFPAVSAAETTRAPPAAAKTPIIRTKAVAKAAAGRARRTRRPWRRPFWASARASGTMRAVRPAGTEGAGVAERRDATS